MDFPIKKEEVYSAHYQFSSWNHSNSGHSNKKVEVKDFSSCRFRSLQKSSEILRGERSQILCCSRNTNSRCNNKMSLKEARGEVNEHIDQHEDTATTQRRGGRLPRRAPGWILLLDQLRVQVKKMTKLCQVDSSLKMSPLLVTSALLPATSPPGKRRACLPGKSSTSPSSLP